MKTLYRTITLCLGFFVLIIPFAQAADIEGLSYDELVALKDQINLAIWNSEEWQEVTVPQGIWEVGADIPAGHWTISPTEGHWTSVEWTSALEESGAKSDISGYISRERLTSPTYDYYEEHSDLPQVAWELTEGTYIIVDYGSAVFTPYAGKPDFGFK